MMMMMMMMMRKFAVNAYSPFITQRNICMNIMRNKTEEFITQLRHAMHGERRTRRSIS